MKWLIFLVLILLVGCTPKPQVIIINNIPSHTLVLPLQIVSKKGS
jgi:hypothetical protein